MIVQMQDPNLSLGTRAEIDKQHNDAIAERKEAEEALRNMLAERNHYSAVLARDLCLHCHDRDCEVPCPFQCNCQHNA